MMLLRTNSATNCGKIVVKGDGVICAFNVPFFQFRDKYRDFDSNGTTCHTRCMLTIKTSTCLFKSKGGSVA